MYIPLEKTLGEEMASLFRLAKKYQDEEFLSIVRVDPTYCFNEFYNLIEEDSRYSIITNYLDTYYLISYTDTLGSCLLILNKEFQLNEVFISSTWMYVLHPRTDILSRIKEFFTTLSITGASDE